MNKNETTYEQLTLNKEKTQPTTKINPQQKPNELEKWKKFETEKTTKYLDRIWNETLDTFDTWQKKRKTTKVAFAIGKTYAEQRNSRKAAAIAFWGFLSTFPLMLIITGVLDILLENNDIKNRILDSALTQIPIIGEQITKDQSLGNGRISIIIGTTAAIWAASRCTAVIGSSIEDTWNIKQGRRGFIKGRLFALQNILVLSTGIAGATTLVSLATQNYTYTNINNILYLLPAATINGITFLIIERSFSQKKIKGHLWGSYVAATGYTATQYLGTYIVDSYLKDASDIYGTFAAVSTLMFWLFLHATIAMSATTTNYVLSGHRWPKNVRD